MTTTMDVSCMPPPEFGMGKDDEYIKPELHTLVTCLFHYNKQEHLQIYRTGVVIHENGQVRFFDGFYNENGQPTPYSTTPKALFSFSKKYFRSEHFRARRDLVVGSLCYDWGEKRWCTITRIDVQTGGVFVVWKAAGESHDGDVGEEELRPADELVGSGRLDDDYVDGDDTNVESEEPCHLQNQHCLSEANIEEEHDVQTEIFQEHDPSRANPSNQQDIDCSMDTFNEDGDELSVGSDDSDGEESVPPRFEISNDDPYVKPKIGELVSYLYHENPNVYRVAVVCSGIGKLRFYDGVHYDKRCYYEDCFCFNKQLFHKGQFRARPELVPNSRCYDAKRQRFCVLKSIDMSCGSVFVVFDGEERGWDISPDHLVRAVKTTEPQRSSVPSEPAQKRRKCNDFERNKASKKGRKEENSPGLARSETSSVASEMSMLSDSDASLAVGQSDEELETLDDNSHLQNDMARTTSTIEEALMLKARVYCGVYVCKESDQEGRKWYIRGRLEESPNGAPPLLLMGESVIYSPEGELEKIELLQYLKRKGMHVEVISCKEKTECRRLAKVAELRYAQYIQAERKEKLRDRLTSMAFRPGQPVFVMGLGDATVVRGQDDGGMLRVEVQNGGIRSVGYYKVRLMDYKPEPIDLDDFFRANNRDLPRNQKYSQPGDFLLRAWENSLGKCNALALKDEFEKKVMKRNALRNKAMNNGGDGTKLTREGEFYLNRRCSKLLQRLQEDFFENDPIATQTDNNDWKSRIVEIKNRLPNPNVMLLCGGIAPEVTAYKRLNAAPLGNVILQDNNLHAVGVAVASHPDVNFWIAVEMPTNRVKKVPGDVHILANADIVQEIEVRIGGVHHVSFTNPCQSFSLAGRKDGFGAEGGQLMWECVEVIRNVAASSEMPSYLGENVRSTHESDEKSDNYLPQKEAKYFYACASMCSPSIRNRKFATNIPPVECLTGPRLPGMPPSLDGDDPSLCASIIADGETRMVHPEMKKFPCLLYSNPTRNACIWEQEDTYKEPVRKPPTPEEAEKAMGYYDNEIGATAYSAEKAVRKRIENHDFEASGCLVSLKGCATDPDFPVEALEPKQRLELLGNSVCVTMLEALMWNDQRMFPPIVNEVD